MHYFAKWLLVSDSSMFSVENRLYNLLVSFFFSAPSAHVRLNCRTFVSTVFVPAVREKVEYEDEDEEWHQIGATV